MHLSGTHRLADKLSTHRNLPTQLTLQDTVYTSTTQTLKHHHTGQWCALYPFHALCFQQTDLCAKVALPLAIMATEKIANVDGLKMGLDRYRKECGIESANFPVIWTGIIKEDPVVYVYENGRKNDKFLIQIQPTKLKDPVWAMGGWTHHPDLSKKDQKVQFNLTHDPGYTIKNADGTEVGKSSEGTMAPDVVFERVMEDQGMSDGQGGGFYGGTPVENPAWRTDLAFE